MGQLLRHSVTHVSPRCKHHPVSVDQTWSEQKHHTVSVDYQTWVETSPSVCWLSDRSWSITQCLLAIGAWLEQEYITLASFGSRAWPLPHRNASQARSWGPGAVGRGDCVPRSPGTRGHRQGQCPEQEQEEQPLWPGCPHLWSRDTLIHPPHICQGTVSGWCCYKFEVHGDIAICQLL